MKVKQCETCEHYRRMTWTSSYKPKGYHRIGVTHAYGYCTLYKNKCLNIKKCDVQKGENNGRI